MTKERPGFRKEYDHVTDRIPDRTKHRERAKYHLHLQTIEWAAGHMSPFEHQAQVNEKAFGVCDLYSGNFRKPWMQYRKMLLGEAVWRPR